MQNDKKSPLAEKEEKILRFWEEKNIFKKSIEKPAGNEPKGDFVFYDGPPFATGLPHFGHILPTSIKDAIPRYKTMRGYRVRRRWGWDCHGLPVENLIEKELNLSTKKDIVNYGIGRFNEAARASVLRYADEWRKIIPRLGRWVDMVDDYRTMDASYTETVWWIFKQLNEKGLVYEGFKVMNLCPRCETTLSNFEVAQGYKDITDISVYVKFELTEEPGTYFLAWTTTPWTLPGNVALAVNSSFEYVKVRVRMKEGAPGGLLILAKDRLGILKDFQHEVIQTFKGTELIGKSYKPLFDYYSKDASLKDRQKGWQIYGGDFVTMTDGTGIVHIAPAFGADDYELLQKHNLPFVQHVSPDGHFKKEVTDFAGMSVKPKSTDEEKDAHQKADIEIIKYLAKDGTLFMKEKIIHSYPHCWRCDTPLLNYASSSWFVKVSSFKDKLVRANKKVKWVPSEVGEGRFGNWLEGARDWSISRSRFWGAPLPVWKEENTRNIHVISSIADLKKFSKSKNTYYAIRHGEAENNVLNVLNSQVDDPKHLTEKGKQQIADAVKYFKDKKIDLVFLSPFVRTRETAEIMNKELGLSKDKVIFDDRLREFDMGIYEGHSAFDFPKLFPYEKRFTERIEGGENYADIRKRTGEFIYEIEAKYQGKNILIISHDTPVWIMMAVAKGWNDRQILDSHDHKDHFLENGKPVTFEFTPLPHNSQYEIDLHRPYIDEVELRSPQGNRLVRVPEVFDCWFESGSMPYGGSHYPFENGKGRDSFDPKGGLFKKKSGFPADFIAEGLDQTRGWFYSMIVLGASLFGESPYKTVVANGLILAEDGQKMSKRKGNFPDLSLTVDKYGADPLRFFLLSSPAVRAQEFCFSEKGVDEVARKHIGRLNNVVTFYEMYAEKKSGDSLSAVENSQNVLDRWIMSRLGHVIEEMTNALEAYELDRACRPIVDFIDDLSTWYIRRSRDRFKGEDIADKNAALQTTQKVLLETSKLIAPLMPFLAEDIYQRVGGTKESVHLEKWPSPVEKNSKLENDMEKVRALSSQALEARMSAKINVRQPLARLSVSQKYKNLSEDLISLIKDEVNIKNVSFDAQTESDISLDLNITSELKEEGTVREFIRSIQDLRKENNLTISDRVVLNVDSGHKDKSLIQKNKKEISQATGLTDITFGNNPEKPLSFKK